MSSFLRTTMALLLVCSPVAAKPILVTTDIPPIQALVSGVLGNYGQVSVLIEGNTDPHHLQLRPSQMRALAQADLMVWLGPELTPWLQGPLSTTMVDTEKLELLAMPETTLRQFDDGQLDPHAWLAPANGLAWVDAIAQSLSELDPEHQSNYAANAAAMKSDIQIATLETTQLLNPLRDQKILLFHDSLGYFTDAFGPIVAGTLSSGDAQKPGAAHLSKIRRLVENGGIACAFHEPGQSPKYLSTVLRNSNIPIEVLDPLGIIPDESNYPDLIRQLGRKIYDCVSP